MERLAQYWDDLDDLYWSLAASGERLRSALRLLAMLILLAAVAVAGYAVAVSQPQAAAAIVPVSSAWLGIRAINGLKYGI
jgi:hypothetical protein